MADGALSTKTKELVALSIAVVKQCDGCIAYRAKAAARRGATPDEVAEALGVALLMDGGPASTYGPRAWDRPTGSSPVRRRPSPETYSANSSSSLACAGSKFVK